ncbi:MAG: thrombospondin type 3 repeat-containing protein, partial [Verrucomicrobia bacterium]|nr:thrombospondin type 3 repeat-containing protein [Verrucomicrobiota bacterium]
PLNTLVSSSSYISPNNPTFYVRYFGADALVYGHYNKQAYPMLRDNMGWKIYLSLGGSDSNPAVRLLTGDAKNDTWTREKYNLDTHNRFFGTRGAGTAAATTALAELDTTSGFFLPNTASIAGHTYKIVYDSFFTTRMVCLANSLSSISGTVVDSDGDGASDSAEVASGSDPFDSGSTPSRPSPPQKLKVRIEH